MRDAIIRYLDLFTGDPPPEPRLSILARRLDDVAAAYHGLPMGALVGPDTPDPSVDFVSLAQERFPELGWYPCVDLLGSLTEQSTMIGDAIDDLADIALDLHRALWTWDNLGEEAAAGELRLLYFHWGEHLRNLQTYLHACICS